MLSFSSTNSYSVLRAAAGLLLLGFLAACQSSTQTPTPISGPVSTPSIAGQAADEDVVTFAFERLPALRQHCR